MPCPEWLICRVFGNDFIGVQVLGDDVDLCIAFLVK